MRYATASLFAAMAVLATVALMAIVAAGAFLVSTHRSSSAQSPESAEREFQRLRAQFANQPPLLDMNQRQARSEGGVASHAPLHAFHTVIFDTRGSQRLVWMTVPYWFGRIYARRGGQLQWLGQLTFLDDTEFDPEPIRLSLDQIERHGPGLIADYRHPGGGQFLSWVD